MNKKEIFIIGCRGLPAKYGGYETFVEQLTLHQRNKNINYHVACRTSESNEHGEVFEHNNANCYKIYVPKLGPASAIYYDIKAIYQAVKYIKKNNIKDPIFYILGCSIGPFVFYARNLIDKVSGKMFINPDGHEWLRAKWGFFAKKYLKYSEKIMVKKADLVICDSSSIEDYIVKEYAKKDTCFIAYGADDYNSKLDINDSEIINWYDKFNLKAKDYYLIVGRFVPENNYETMIREFMKSKSDKKLVIITNYENNKYFETLKKKTNFLSDSRILFVGTVYNQELLKKIREQSYAYLHGHSVGGTNPSLLEALASTDVNLLYNVNFNIEVAEDSALYWSKDEGDLAKIIDDTDKLDQDRINGLAISSTNIIKEKYSWTKIVNQYESLFIQ